MKLVYSDKKSGKTGQLDIPKDTESVLLGKKIGDEVEASAFGMTGAKLKITGLSDNTGSPSRSEIEGTIKSRPLLNNAPGIRNPKRGFRARRLVRGNMISTDTAQVNTVILEFGSAKAEELFKPKEKKEQ